MTKNFLFPLNLNSNSRNENPLINPELEGQSFFWEGGEIGILLIHGLTTTTAEVRPLAKCLNNQGFSVSGILLPGHGTKPEDLNKTHRNSWIQECEKAYLKLRSKCSFVFIAASSAGCLIALKLASKYKEIRGLLLYAPAMRLAISFLETYFLIAVLIV